MCKIITPISPEYTKLLRDNKELSGLKEFFSYYVNKVLSEKLDDNPNKQFVEKKDFELFEKELENIKEYKEILLKYNIEVKDPFIINAIAFGQETKEFDKFIENSPIYSSIENWKKENIDIFFGENKIIKNIDDFFKLLNNKVLYDKFNNLLSFGISEDLELFSGEDNIINMDEFLSILKSFNIDKIILKYILLKDLRKKWKMNPITKSNHLKSPKYLIQTCIYSELTTINDQYIDSLVEKGCYIDYNLIPDSKLKDKIFNFKGYKRHTYVLSYITDEIKFSDSYKKCTGIVGIGKDKISGKNLSFLTHQDPDFFLLKDSGINKKFKEELVKLLNEFKDKCDPGTIDIIMVGGNNHNYSEVYKRSMYELDNIIYGNLSIKPLIIGGPSFPSPSVIHSNLGIGKSVIVDTQSRRVFFFKNDGNASFSPNFIADNADKILYNYGELYEDYLLKEHHKKDILGSQEYDKKDILGSQGYYRNRIKQEKKEEQNQGSGVNIIRP